MYPMLILCKSSSYYGLISNPYNEINSYIVAYVPVHSIGATHCFMVSSITVPFGHSHPLTIQAAGQATGSVVLHV